MKVYSLKIVTPPVTFLFGCLAVYTLHGPPPPAIETSGTKPPVTEAAAFSNSTAASTTAAEPDILEENLDWQSDDAGKFSVKMFESGEGYHGEETPVKNGERWLTLYQKNGRYFLEQKRLAVSAVHDPVVDGYDEQKAKQKTGKSVKLPDNADSVFLLKNVGNLRGGEIPTLYRYDAESDNPYDDELVSMRAGLARKFRVAEKAVTLKVKKGLNRQGESILALVVENETTSQVIHSIKDFEDGGYAGSLIWAGDLDRDGEVDFYFDLYFHDNVSYRNLYLSSKAEKKKLVKKFAQFSISGC